MKFSTVIPKPFRRSARTSTLPADKTWGVRNTAGVSIPHELSFSKIGYRIGAATILDDISLQAQSGTVTCLLGPSGSGKTTLLRIAAGIEQQTSGSVSMDGREIAGDQVFVQPEKRGIGIVFQDYALFPHLTIFDNVAFGLSHLPRHDRRSQAVSMLSRVGLADRADDYPHNLSGGEQQRVALARALAPRPGILLMDEPFSGLDARLRDTMREQTLEILHETRATAIVVTHDPQEALRMGDQIALLQKGCVWQVGSGAQLYYRPESLFAASFFSELNQFSGRVKGDKLQTALGSFSADGLPDGTKAIAALRLNSIEVTPSKSAKGTKKVSSPSASGEHQATGRVLTVDFSGDHHHLRVGLMGSDQIVRARAVAGALPIEALSGGADVVLTVKADGCFVFPALEEDQAVETGSDGQIVSSLSA